MGLRFAVSRAHGRTPYSVLFGREPLLPSCFRVRDFDLEAALATESEAAAEEFADELAVYLADVRRVARERLMLYDARSKRYYDEQRIE